MNTTGNTILITGGGSGIGRELAREFHTLGNTVIVAGRTAASLEETIAGRAGMHARTLDVGSGPDIARFAKAIAAALPIPAEAPVTTATRAFIPAPFSPPASPSCRPHGPPTGAC